MYECANLSKCYHCYTARQMTLTFESLTEQSIEHRSAVLAEGRRHVVVDLEAMWNVDVESFRQHLFTSAAQSQ